MTIPVPFGTSSLPVLDPFEDLIRLFRTLSRKGPGTEAITLRALRACGPLPPEPTVLDLGCGSGASTLVLARTLGVPITAVDACGPFLDELQQRARDQGLADRILPQCLDFGKLPFPPESFDLLWSEGAVFCLGWEAGLQAWKPLVRPGGFLALTEAVWFKDNPPTSAKAAWSQWNPAMGTMAQCAAAAEALGLEVVDVFPLPAEAWWDYYEPLERRCCECASDPSLAERIAEIRKEIEVYRECDDSYGYAFFVFRKP
jgi:SAM-dependent methyltransferase